MSKNLVCRALHNSFEGQREVVKGEILKVLQQVIVGKNMSRYWSQFFGVIRSLAPPADAYWL